MSFHSRKYKFAALAACSALMGLSCVLPAFAAGGDAKAEVLLQTNQAWTGDAYKAYPKGNPQLSVLKISVPPNSSLPWHTHPFPNAGYILSGSITVEQKSTGLKKVYTTGQVIPEAVDIAHRGFTGDDGAVLIVFYAGTEGVALAHILD
ncbi:cupin domain-containing protein [Pseudomonas sp. NPDC089554]|uniref:cupin domain-containing protein n=1 Tax=Pseudomonas sp. NPDC089554 TaxID=3390653 RepID=UPI003CFFD2D2